MRQIKFRGKNANGKWVFGDLITDGKDSPNKALAYIMPELSRSYDFDECVMISLKTAGQFTGITDKNGVEIFEGDVCKGKRPYAETHIVVWDEKRCGFYLNPIDGLGRASYDKGYKMNSGKLEVIGNIHDKH